MKKIIAISTLFVLILSSIPAGADDSESNASRYQTANVFSATMGPGLRMGAARLTRSTNRIEGRIMTNVATAGDPYTLWIIVFNNPKACIDGCNDEDLGIPEVHASVYNASGAISAANGLDGGVINIDFSASGGKLANGQFLLLGDPKGLRRGKGFKAEIHLVVDQHPSVIQGPDSWIADLTTTNFPGGPAVSVAAAIFLPCPDAECPASAL